MPGISRAYGMELLLKKNLGRHKYWIAYTLSKSEQKTPGRNNNENGINMSKWYNTPYDKTHDFSINSEYNINKKLKIVGNFIFQTGQPTNYPNSQYNYMNLNVPNYGERNSQRLPNYHRLDINLTLTPNKNDKKIESSWVFGVYNIWRVRFPPTIHDHIIFFIIPIHLKICIFIFHIFSHVICSHIFHNFKVLFSNFL